MEIQKLGAERALILSGDRMAALDPTEEIQAGNESASDGKDNMQSSLKECRDQAERDLIIATLKKHGGNISRGALDLSVRRPYPHRRMTALKISKKDYLG